uniref:C-type lectin domain-containing protein n=1 Tax=Panagrolaimus sp. JU765 TaxID=591449 RepID=A0AC34RNL0_9BILA
MLKFFILIIICVTQIECNNCPSGAVKSETNNVCYTFSTKAATFVQAQVSCSEQGGNLVDVDSQKTNMFLIANTAKRNWENFWIGGNATQIYNDDGVMKVWIWEGVRKLMDYNNWGPNEPVNKKGCAAVNATDGTWFVEDCGAEKNYVCSIPMKMDVCDDQWIYFSLTGFCYKVYYHSDWTAAESACLAQGAHLVSVHSKQENDFVQDISRCGINLYDWDKGTIVGLFSNGDISKWSWSDGTPFDYFYWAGPEPNNPGGENCGSIFTDPEDNSAAGYWNNVPCDAPLRNYICKKLPKKVKII